MTPGQRWLGTRGRRGCLGPWPLGGETLDGKTMEKHGGFGWFPWKNMGNMRKKHG